MRCIKIKINSVGDRFATAEVVTGSIDTTSVCFYCKTNVIILLFFKLL